MLASAGALALQTAALSAQSSAPASVGTGSAAVEVICRIEVPSLCAVRDIQPVDVRHLGDGLHEVSFDVIVGSNTAWKLAVSHRRVAGAATPAIEVRNAEGRWVPVRLDGGPVTLVAGLPRANRHAERVVFRLRAENHRAALQLVQFDVSPVNP